MKKTTIADKIYSIEKCNAKILAGDLVRCLSVEQASSCQYALPFGEGYLCKHPRRGEIIKNTKSSPEDLPPMDADNL
jgi:hypothetical protein